MRRSAPVAANAASPPPAAPATRSQHGSVRFDGHFSVDGRRRGFVRPGELFPDSSGIAPVTIASSVTLADQIAHVTLRRCRECANRESGCSAIIPPAHRQAGARAPRQRCGNEKPSAIAKYSEAIA